MNDKAKAVEITILGRDYRVACSNDSERESLLTAAAFLDRRMREIRDSSKVTGNEKIAVMAALNIAHEFLSTKLPGGFDIADFKRRMQSMQTTLDTAMSQQEKLF
jgi:cell division protein ZapA